MLNSHPSESQAVVWLAIQAATRDEVDADLAERGWGEERIDAARAEVEADEAAMLAERVR
jgi:hypothetical protein